MTIKLGQKVKDTVSGFKGTAVCVTEWLMRKRGGVFYCQQRQVIYDD